MSRLALVVSFAFLAGAVLLRLRYAHPLWVLDEYAYVSAAIDANERGWWRFILGISSIYENRLSLVLPLAASMKLLGTTEAAIHALGAAFSLGAIAVTYAIGNRLHGPRVALIAAIIAAIIPQEVWTSASVTPDTAMPLYTGLALYFAILAQQRPRLDAAALAWYALSALATICAFEARATGGVVLGVLGLWGLLQPRQRLTRAALPGVFFVVLIIATWALFAATGGSFALQIRQLVMDGTGTPWTGTGQPFQHLFFMMPAVRFLVELPGLLFGARSLGFTDLARYAVNTFLGLHFYVVWAAFVYVVVRWRRLPTVHLPVVAFAFLYGFFEFGSTSLTSYQPIWKFERFLTILTVPSSVLIAIAAIDLYERAALQRKPLLAVVIAALYVAVAGAILEANHRFWGDPALASRQIFGRLQSMKLPSTRMFVMSGGWATRGHALLRLNPPLEHDFQQLDSREASTVHDAIVILDRSYLEPWARHFDLGQHYDPLLRHAPNGLPGWKLLFEVPLRTFERQSSVVQVFAVP